MDKLLAGPFGAILVIAMAGFFVYQLRGLAEIGRGDDSIGRTYAPGRRKASPSRPRPSRPESSNRGSYGWSRRSPTMETWSDESTGAMSGYVLQGMFAGRRLEDLSRTECMRLFDYYRTEDLTAAEFLQAYMIRRFAGGDAGSTRNAHRDEQRAPPPPEADDGAMTRARAFEILGLPMGANEADVHKAHRALIKKYHPDHGGTHAQAARINQAKDTLLARVH